MRKKDLGAGEGGLIHGEKCKGCCLCMTNVSIKVAVKYL